MDGKNIHISTKKEILTCPICGGTYENQKRGRTRSYCSTACSNIFKYKSALERELLKISPERDNARILKGDLWRLSNLIKIKRGICKRLKCKTTSKRVHALNN